MRNRAILSTGVASVNCGADRASAKRCRAPVLTFVRDTDRLALISKRSHAPVGAVLLALRKAQGRRGLLRPKASAPSAVPIFSCKAVTSKGAAMGAVGAAHGPPQLPAVASVRQLAAEAMPPLWQYLHMEPSGKRAHLRTQRCRPLPRRPFLLQNGNFLGAEVGAMGADHGPPQAGSRVCARAGGEGHALLWQYFWRQQRQATRAHVRPQGRGSWAPLGISAGKRALLGAERRAP